MGRGKCKVALDPMRPIPPPECHAVPLRRARARLAQAAENAERRELVPVRRKSFDPGL